MQDSLRECSSCHVKVSNDLSFCPLCGKYLLEEDEKIENTNTTYPDYDYTFIVRGKWIRTIRNLLIDIGLICFLVNIMFKTTPFWFPYVETALILIYFTIFEPFKRRNNYMRYFSRIAVLSSLFLMFIDYYDYVTIGTKFGWAIAYTTPFVLCGFNILIGILAFSNKKNDIMHFYSAIIMFLISIVNFLIRFVWLKEFIIWPTLMYLCASVVIIIVLFTFKYKKIFKDIHKRFHI